MIAQAAPELDNYLIESKVQTRSGLIERYRDKDDERFYFVKLIDPKTKAEKILEDHSRNLSSRSKTERMPSSFLMGETSGSEYLVLRDGDDFKILGESRRIFEKSTPCSAIARVQLPTPLSHSNFWILNDLECADPLTTSGEKIEVLGRKDQNWLQCESSNHHFCFWKPRYKQAPEAATQLSTYTTLWRAEGELMRSGIDAFLPKIRAKSWAFDSNRSLYDATQKMLFFGSGEHPDGLDGFVVSHEWTHFLIDELNPGLVGRSAEIIHEGLSDFFAANMFNSPCFAPFEALDYPDRKCFRNLENNFKFPDNMIGGDRHQSSLILSGALWEAREYVPPSLMNEILVESAIRLPKIPDFLEYWKLFEDIYARFLEERELLDDHWAEISAIGQNRGLKPTSR